MSELRLRKIGWILMSVLVLLLCIYSLSYFIPGMPYGFRPDVYPESMLSIFLLLHIAGAILAALAGPLQFWRAFREKRRRMHRCLGYIYLVGVAVAAPSALIISTISQGGLTTHVAFSLLAIFWAGTTTVAFLKIIKGDWQAHQQWMIRSYALTLAFVTLRLWMAGLAFTGLPVEQVYQTVAWLCWVLNMVIAEYYLIYSSDRARLNSQKSILLSAA